MGINPNRPPSSDVLQGLQRATYADLPDPNKTPAFTVALVEQTVGLNAAGLYVVQIDSEPVGHSWVFIGPSAGGGGSTLPTLRFVVARAGYGGGTIGDVVPNTTYTNANPAVALNAALAAAATYRATLQALPEFAAYEAKVSVMLHPDHYVGTFNVPAGVTIEGLGANPSDTLVDRINFASPTGLSCGASNLMLIGDGGNVAMSSADGGVNYAILLDSVECYLEPLLSFLHQGSLTNTRCVLGQVSWTSAAGTMNSQGSQYAKLTLSNVDYRSKDDRNVGVFGDPDPIVTLSGGVSAMQDTLIGVRNNPLSVMVFLSNAASLTAIRCDFLADASLGGSIFDADQDTLPSSLAVRDITAPGNNVLYGPPSRLSVTSLSGHDALTILEQPGAIVGPGFVTVTPLGSADIIEVTPVYSVPNTATTFLLVALPSAGRLAPGRRITIKNRSFPATPGAGGIALVTSGEPIDNLASSAAPVLVTSSSHVIIAPGSQVTVYVRNNRSSFGILAI